MNTNGNLMNGEPVSRKFRHTNTLRNHGTGQSFTRFYNRGGVAFSCIVMDCSDRSTEGIPRGIQGDSKVINFTV